MERAAVPCANHKCCSADIFSFGMVSDVRRPEARLLSRNRGYVVANGTPHRVHIASKYSRSHSKERSPSAGYRTQSF